MIEIRAAEPDDLERVVALEEICEGPDAWSRSLMAEGIAGLLPTVSYFVAVDDARIVGYAIASYVDDVAELQRLGVEPEARRQGIGGMLLRTVIRAANEAERVLLEVREDNHAARALYANAGFTELDRRPKYYRDGSEAIVLVRAVTL